MKFDRIALEDLHDALEEAQARVSGLLEVLPDGCEVYADFDFFTPDVCVLEYSGTGRFPSVPIQGDTLGLYIALDELADVVSDIEVERTRH